MDLLSAQERAVPGDAVPERLLALPAHARLRSPSRQVQADCSQLLARLLELPLMRKALRWVYADVEAFIKDEQLTALSGEVMLYSADDADTGSDEEAAKRACALFVLGILHSSRRRS